MAQESHAIGNALAREAGGAVSDTAHQRASGAPTTRDVVSGLVSAVLNIALTVSYAVLIFSGPLAANLLVGIGYGLIGATITAIVFAASSGVPFALAGPDSKPAAVLATL